MNTIAAILGLLLGFAFGIFTLWLGWSLLVGAIRAVFGISAAAKGRTEREHLDHIVDKGMDKL